MSIYLVFSLYFFIIRDTGSADCIEEYSIHQRYDYDYLDSQAEYVVLQIMKADGATDYTIHSVLNGKAKYQF